MTSSPEIRAAGGVVRRRCSGKTGGLEVALVHRPRYDDWTLPKGKAEEGERPEATALREVREETGLVCELGPEIGSSGYADPKGRNKLVRYWLMTPAVDGGLASSDGTPDGSEVDEIRWLPTTEADALLTHDVDRDVLRDAAGFDRPVCLVRHAKAGDRSSWTEDDELRPLSRPGRRQAEALVDALEHLAPTRIFSSPYVRCVQTVRPLALALGVPVEESEALAEGAHPAGTLEFIRTLRDTAVLCSHGDVIPQTVLGLAGEGMRIEGERAWQKGSTWILQREGGLPVAATYVPPPPV
jgi:8-oxo-dGTP diphosphatase